MGHAKPKETTAGGPGLGVSLLWGWLRQTAKRNCSLGGTKDWETGGSLDWGALASMIALTSLRVYIQNLTQIMLTARAHGLKSL